MTDPAIAANLRATAARATEVLEQLDQALRHAGFVQATPGYREMAGLVVRQRLLAAQAGLADLDAAYARVATLAGAVHGVLAGAAEALRPLAALPALAAAPDAPAPEAVPPAAVVPPAAAVPLDRRVIDLLRAQRGPVAATRLRSAVGRDRATLAPVLAALEAQGAVRRVLRGGREHYALA